MTIIQAANNGGERRENDFYPTPAECTGALLPRGSERRAATSRASGVGRPGAMSEIHLDVESRSIVDLPKCGVHVYSEHESTDVLCAAYAVDDGPVKVWKRGDPAPLDIVEGINNGAVFTAHNSAFDRTVWRQVLAKKYGWPKPPAADRWRCSMAMALAMSLPASLKNACAAVGLELGGKADEGRALMLQMSHPRRARKDEDPNGVYWFEDEERLERLYAICAKDVEDERELEKRLLKLRPDEQKLWELDAKINDRGIYVDVPLCNAALKIVNQATAWLDDEVRTLTEGAVSATTNVAQIKRWLRLEGFETESLDKDHIEDMLLRTDLPPAVRRVLEVRREAAKAAVKKIDALLAGRSQDGRAKGLLQFHAAGTGRWAGRRYQPQNLARPNLDDIDGAIEAVETGDAEYVRVVYGEPLAVVSDCLRGMVKAAPGNRLYAADFSNIEGRLQAWLADEQWKLDAFTAFDAGKGPDLYKLAYARSFGIAATAVDKTQRQVGKVMELALGYQGGVGAFQKMAVNYGVSVSDERADELKMLWREAHPNIVQCWYDLEDAAKRAISDRGKAYSVGPIGFRCAGSFLFMRLPSGRCIVYPYPCMKNKMMPWGENRMQVSYKGTDTYTRKWTDQFAHGGMLFNNAVQGAARDVEAEAMVRVERAGYWNVLSVHDEVVCETRENFGSVAEFEKLMTVLPDWLPGMPLAAGAWTAERYRK